MTSHTFVLQPFAGTQTPTELAVTGQIRRQDHHLSLHYQIEGAAEVAIAPPADIPDRQDNLWQSTCLEFFLALPESTPYWEFNLSPAGHWNVYRFTDYRQGMQAEPALSALPMEVSQLDNQFCLQLQFDLRVIALAQQPLLVGITAVVQLTNGSLTYWALSHPSPVADFHQRDSFILQI